MNPVKRFAEEIKAKNLGNLAVFETMMRTNRLTKAAKDLLGNQNYLYPKRTFQEEVLPEFDPMATLMFAFMFGEKTIPRELKKFYKGILK